jgi:hypothetical protein
MSWDERKEVFERVEAHLLEQGERSVDKVACLYRDMHGRKCAIGCLIDDLVYIRIKNDASLPPIEHASAEQEPVLTALRRSGIDAEDEEMSEMLMELQEIHDDDDPGMWDIKLEGLARRQGFR